MTHLQRNSSTSHNQPRSLPSQPSTIIRIPKPRQISPRSPSSLPLPPLRLRSRHQHPHHPQQSITRPQTLPAQHNLLLQRGKKRHQVTRYILSEAKTHAQQLETQILAFRVAARRRGHFRSLSGSFWSTPVATDEERLATALARAGAEERECKHWALDGLRMLSLDEKAQSLVKWPVGYKEVCAICEREFEIGRQYTRCRGCKSVRCRGGEWMWSYKGEG